MTNQELIDYYTDLLIMQYRGKTKARGTVAAFTEEFIINQLPIQIREAFNLETAVGVQLDVIGKYIGISRKGLNFSGVVTLNDDDYRIVLTMKSALNNISSSLKEIDDLIFKFFSKEILVFDYEKMRMSYFVDTALGNLALVEFLILQDLLPKPMGVRLSTTIYTDAITTLYGFRTYTHTAINTSPMNTYAVYDMAYPWLSYSYAVI